MVWLKRLLIFAALLIWFSLVLFPFFAFTLARNDQIEVRNTRIFLVQSLDTNGVGFHTVKPAREPAVCSTSRLRYILWEGEGENAYTCTCNDGIDRIPEGRNSCVAP